MHTQRTANLLGATALAVTDRTVGGAARSAGVSASGAAALVVLSATPGISVTELGRRVGLSQPAAARMLDALEAAGLAERRPGVGRWVTAELTPEGRSAVGDLLAARGEPLTTMLGALDADEQETLGCLLAKLLTALYEESGESQRLCRLCDRKACMTGGECPVGAAERARAPAAPAAATPPAAAERARASGVSAAERSPTAAERPRGPSA